MWARDLAAALDPVRLAQRTGLQPDPWQAALLRTDCRQLLMNCARQSGKSVCAAWLAVHETLYRPRSLALCLSPSQRQSGELFRKVREGYGSLGADVPAPSQESALRLELPNRSRVVCLPGTERTIRGFSGVTLLLIDEASRVPDDLYQAVRPMLAVSGGRLVLLSTPWGQRGFFFHEWQNGAGWERVMITAHQCPRIDPEWLAAERLRIPDAVFKSEYECEFTTTLDAAFTYDQVMGALREEVEPWFLAVPPQTEPAPARSVLPPPALSWGST